MATGVLQGGDTFADGQVVTGARLNNMVNLGDVLAGLISTKTDPGSPLGTDYVLYLETASGSLRKAKLSELPAQVSSVALSMPSTEFTVTGSPVTTTGTLTTAWKSTPGNKFLAGTGTGAAFRFLFSGDLALPSAEITASTIDWTLGNLFHKTLTGTTTFSFANPQDGQTIRVLLAQDSAGGHHYNLPHGMWWRGGAFPVGPTFAPFVVDIFTFTCYGTAIMAYGEVNFQIID